MSSHFPETGCRQICANPGCVDLGRPFEGPASQDVDPASQDVDPASQDADPASQDADPASQDADPTDPAA